MDTGKKGNVSCSFLQFSKTKTCSQLHRYNDLIKIVKNGYRFYRVQKLFY